MPEVSPKRPWIETPLVESASLSKIAGCRIFLKLDNLQPSGSFKSRGIGNFLLSSIRSSASASQKTPHFYISSGGNAGLACVAASSTLNYESTVVVPHSTKQHMIDKLKIAGAEVVQHGANWFEADQYLRNELMPKDKEHEAVYVPPFDHEDVWEGASTMVDEWERQLAVIDGVRADRVAADAVVCSVGGGGMFCGIMGGLERSGSSDKTTVIAVETLGAESLHASIKAGQHVTLPAITSIATSLGAIRVAPRAYEYAQGKNVRSVVVDDREAVRALIQFLDKERMMVEPACGASLAIGYGYGGDEHALSALIPDFNEGKKVVIVVCGGSAVNLDLLAQWKETFELQ